MSWLLILIYWHADIFFHLSSISTPRSAFQNFLRLLFSLAKHTLQGILLLYQHLSKNISANADVAPPRLTAAHLLNLRDTIFHSTRVLVYIRRHGYLSVMWKLPFIFLSVNKITQTEWMDMIKGLW